MGPLLGLIGSAIGTAANIGMNSRTNQTNLDINRQMMNYNREEAEKADERTRALYNDLYSPEARVQQLKNAGLSVGLMYGQNGMGGTMSTQGAHANGINPLGARATQIDPLGLSQIQVNDATANKLNAEANLMKEQENTQKDVQNQLKALKNNLEQNTKNLTEELNNIKQALETDKQREDLFKAQTDLTETQKQLNSQLWQYNEDTYFIRMDALLKQNEIFNETARKIRAETQNEKDKHELFNLTKSMQLDYLGLQIKELLQKIELVNPAQAALLNQQALVKSYEAKDWQTFKETCNAQGIPASKSFFNAATEYEKIKKRLEADKELTKYRHIQETIWGAPEQATKAFGKVLGSMLGMKLGLYF